MTAVLVCYRRCHPTCWRNSVLIRTWFHNQTVYCSSQLKWEATYTYQDTQNCLIFSMLSSLEKKNTLQHFTPMLKQHSLSYLWWAETISSLDNSELGGHLNLKNKAQRLFMFLSKRSYAESHIFTLQSQRSPDGTITHCLSDFSLFIHMKSL